MKKIFVSAVFATSLAAFVPFAQAEDLYVGVNVAGSIDGHVNVGQGATATRHDAVGKQRPLGLYAGYVLSPGWALEAGYGGAGGSTDYNLDAIGHMRLRTSMAYVAARAEWKPGQDWALYGKAGVAQGRLKIDLSGDGGKAGKRVHENGAYLALGAAWYVTPNVSLQLEFEHTNTIKHEGLTAKMDKVSLGARFGF